MSKSRAVELIGLIKNVAQNLNDGDIRSEAHLKEWGENVLKHVSELENNVKKLSDDSDVQRHDEITKRLIFIRDQNNRIERYLEGQFLSGNYNHTEQMATQLAIKMKNSPRDITLMQTIEKLDNDQQIIAPRLRKLVADMWQWIIDNDLSGRKLKYFRTEAPKEKGDVEKTMIILDSKK